jgi:hypothetical protein
VAERVRVKLPRPPCYPKGAIRNARAGVLIGFETEEDWFDYRLEHDPRFLRRIEQARGSLRAGRSVRLEDTETK